MIFSLKRYIIIKENAIKSAYAPKTLTHYGQKECTDEIVYVYERPIYYKDYLYE